MKTKFQYFFIGLALLAGVHQAAAQTALGIVPTNNQVILVSPNWLSATDAFPVDYGSQIAVSVTNVSSARFFRLSLVPPTADGMALIPAGSFTIGDVADTNLYGDATP